MIGIIKRNFIHMEAKTFILLYKALVRPHVEYANSVWNPYKKGDIEEIEKVQKRATKLIKGLKKLSYEERLRKLRLPTLKYRRIRGDMIEVYKVISGKYDSSVSMQIPTNVESLTRGNKYKLIKDSFRLDIRKYSFSARIVNIWNSLPNQVVDVNTVNLFKTRLDKFWRFQNVVFDFTADLAVIGDRSECVMLNV